jgi:hypothetical protein
MEVIGTSMQIIEFNVEATVSFYDEDLIRKLSNTKHFRNHIVEKIKLLKDQKKLVSIQIMQITF